MRVVALCIVTPLPLCDRMAYMEGAKAIFHAISSHHSLQSSNSQTGLPIFVYHFTPHKDDAYSTQ
jgi:hypothetical protein